MSPALPFLAVKEFAKYQHYRDRHPPWIKLYTRLLGDREFALLPEAAQAQLIKLWILASQFGNPLPNDPKLLAGKIGTTGRFYLPEIIAAGFLIPTEQEDASKMLAESSENASKMLGVQGERREIEIETTSSPRVRRSMTQGEDRLAARLPSDPDRLALTAVCATVPSPATWVAEMSARLDGMHLPMLTPEQLGSALREYVGNGAIDRPNFRHFCGYLTNTAKPTPDRPRAGSTVAQRTLQNGLDALKDIA